MLDNVMNRLQQLSQPSYFCVRPLRELQPPPASSLPAIPLAEVGLDCVMEPRCK